MSGQLANLEPGNNTDFQRPTENVLLGLMRNRLPRSRIDCPGRSRHWPRPEYRSPLWGGCAAQGTTSVEALPHMPTQAVILGPGVGPGSNRKGEKGKKKQVCDVYSSASPAELCVACTGLQPPSGR